MNNNAEELELGYTPKNLRYIRKVYNLTQKEVAYIAGCKDWKQVSRWEADLDHHTHADMPFARWQKLKDFLTPNEQEVFKMPPLKIIDLGVPNTRRIVRGSFLNIFDLNYTKSLQELQNDIQFCIEKLQETQSFWKNLIMFRNRNIIVYKGNNHIDIIADGEGSLNWLFIGDEYFPYLNNS